MEQNGPVQDGVRQSFMKNKKLGEKIPRTPPAHNVPVAGTIRSELSCPSRASLFLAFSLFSTRH
jgi:hypothetical protein